MRWHLAIVLLFAGAAASAGQSSASDRARLAYEGAMREQSPSRRVELLTQSYEALPTFEAGIAIAEALLVQGKSPLDARRWCERAYGLAQPGNARARALFRWAETYRATGALNEYKALLKKSVAEYPTKIAEDALRNASVPGPKTANEIVQTWRAAELSDLRAASVEPAVDLYVNFEFDTAKIDRSGDSQLRALADAIGLVASGGRRRVRVIGHTDAQGADAYNLDLSRRRADSVKAALVSQFGLSPQDIETEGRGKRDLLTHGETPQDHAINRRVEVKLLP
jgi:outer membrane protein OmpA-like peptidoglycan-associated protein